ncbi:MAG TPA: NADH-quinone oxidoreductase subunit L [Dokdonella sp.]|uniref:NADH-quinone oxidoreductase subunit L n=1 Tax=Dokdonella sp. TaxID=2291710 RepID=UPI002CDFC8B3|nr:NADH-quinone oxidoreductase subunit L [Xanthomonadales bacterium]MBL0221347.1 NADH-quinone oxidoreductase subunit L [Xanthomonadales bacterium]HQV71497.1 NADH-quinone oxidoreductase subunit L [Dokdonella sp.]HQW76915.1 NADH-quinone oxidoreductase subunit L [Dokdonella sp.]HQX64397.1 NADH-quinone oxidoreductase subunit L [Dokdonella sp.]
MMLDKSILLTIVLAPLFGALVAGLFGKRIGRVASHSVTIAGVALSCVLSILVLYKLVWGGAEVFNQNIYTWFEVGSTSAHVGFLIDRLTAMMMVVVTFVSLMVHVYTIGYMAEDDGYERFFSYIALFTFSMLMLVMSNNFLQLFFGWEAVGLVSYLLIGFWYKRPTAIFANMKAFIVNRVGDFGFLLGIAGVLLWFGGSLDYAAVFAHAQDPSLDMASRSVELIAGHPWQVATIVCICLFIGAMGKSAQVPLHVWLPDSMEGPTPISALIHAATMVTAGIFMVARMSPLFELSETALTFVLVIGATTALFTGLIGVVQNDIKRVVAYSTLSQLGYMTVALGVSAYSAGVFHLMTHAFFKALLFLGAGSVIIAMHHEQDMRHMGGLRKYMPITWITMWIGSLALAGAPGFAGFFSKDAIIEAVGESHRLGAGYAYFCVLAGVFITALYSFRLLYMTFHGKQRFVVDPVKHHHGHEDPEHHAPGHLAHAPHESPWVVTVPLVLLAIPSIVIGFLTIGPMLFGDYFGNAIFVREANDVIGELGHGFHGALAMILHGFSQPPFWIALAGFIVATWIWLFNPRIADKAENALRPLHAVLANKYWFDNLYQAVFARGGIRFGRGLWRGSDATLIDGAINGSASLVDQVSALLRRLQSGYLYHYAFAMILGLILLLGGSWWVLTRIAA